MCGRFVQRYTWDDVHDLYDLPDGPARNLQAHYNVAPTDPVNVVRPLAEPLSWSQCAGASSHGGGRSP
jgi:putative SOS response-associated peptidase YedK